MVVQIKRKELFSIQFNFQEITAAKQSPNNIATVVPSRQISFISQQIKSLAELANKLPDVKSVILNESDGSVFQFE